MIATILLTVCVTLWCLFSFCLYGYHYLLEVILDLPLIGESPCSAHSALKLIVQKIIREANDLPKLRGEGTSDALNQVDRTYEDLLSTAILNKIISSSQHNINQGTTCSSRANSSCSHRSSSSRRRKLQKEYYFGEKTLNNKWKHIDTDTASVSSIEEWVHSDSSLGSTKYVDRLSLTIKQRIEEASTSDSDQEVDQQVELEENEDVEYFRSSSAFDSDQPNWFLQKRPFRGGTTSPVPVPMLVPDPTIEAKVLIGDKEIDDTSDLSDVPSDLEDEKNVAVALLDVKNHLIDSKTLIGGKNPLADLSFSHRSDDEVSADSGVKECKDLDEADSDVFSTPNKNENDFRADASCSSDGSHTERDTEYTERYATLPRTILLSPQTNKQPENQNNGIKRQNNNDNAEINELAEETYEDNQIEFTGVYSQREKEKWKHAVELKNNPYSKENIERRIKTRNSINSLFGSDYYIRQACLPSGAKRSEVEEPASEQISSPEEYPNEGQNGEHVFIATPVYATEEIPENLEDSQNSNQLNSLEQEIEKHFSSEFTSDSDISLVNCYDVTESVVYKKQSADDEEIQTAEKFFDFESLETSLNLAKEDKEEKRIKPVAKPRKLVNSEKIIDTEVPIIDTESDMIRLVSYKDKSEEINFDTPPYIINRRSDNTLIKKIYSDPSVRSFALSNRNKLPIGYEEIPNNKPVSQNNKPQGEVRTERKKQTSVTKNNKVIVEKTETEPKNSERNQMINLTTDTNLISGNQEVPDGDNQLECFKAQSLAFNNKILDCEAVSELNELKEQKLVAYRLKEFSKSSINLSQISDENLDRTFSSGLCRNVEVSASSEDEEPVRKLSGLRNGEKSASVRDLRKKFEQFDANAKIEKPILYSLTGRSISKQFKEKLRELNEDIPSLSQIHSLSLSNLEVEENTR